MQIEFEHFEAVCVYAFRHSFNIIDTVTHVVLYDAVVFNSLFLLLINSFSSMVTHNNVNDNIYSVLKTQVLFRA